MSTPFKALFVLTLLPLTARAGDVVIEATGTVFSAPSTSGAFAGVQAGQAARIRFEVFTPGTLGTPGFATYTVDVSTILVEAGSGSATGAGGSPTILLQNGNPGGTDGIRQFSAPITGGSTCVFDFGVVGNLFDSLDITQDFGTWTPTTWSAYDWRVFGGGNNIEFTPVTITITNHEIGTKFCFGDGTATACPCGNASPVADQSGCLSSLGTGGRILANGNASLSGDTVVLSGSQMPNSSALYFQGTNQQGGGAGAAFGDGLRCAGGAVVRLKTVVNAAGASQYPGAGDASVSVRGGVLVPGVRTYQIWYRNAAAFCTSATFNLTNGLEITWAS